MEVRPHEAIPRFYGVAYHNPMRLTVVCYVFPVNHIVAISRKIWQKIRDAPISKVDLENLEVIDNFKKNYCQQEGKVLLRQGFDVGWEKGIRFLSQNLRELSKGKTDDEMRQIAQKARSKALETLKEIYPA